MAQSALSGPTRFQSVQVLRALAALAVVAFHTIEADQSMATAWAVGLQSGVDVFFVVSGFVMVVTTERRAISPIDFLAGRLRRIVPLFWLSMLATCFAIKMDVIHRPPPDAVEIIKTAAFIFHTDSCSGQPLPFVGQAWTLNYEVVFYIVFGATLRLPPARQIGVITFTILALAMCRPFADQADAFAMRMTSPLPLEFVAGMLIARNRNRITAISGAAAASMGAASALCLMLYLPGPRTLAVGIPAAVLVLCALRLEPIFSSRHLALLRTLGDASYALYLSHALAIAAVGIVISNALILFFIAVFCGFIVHRAVELPLERLLRGTHNNVGERTVSNPKVAFHFQRK